MEEHIIAFVQDNPFIYDKSHKAYKNVWLRDKKFQELSTKLNIPAKQLKDRWRTLRDKFNRSKQREPSGSGASSPKKWKWEDSMAFLHDIDTENLNTTCNFEEVAEVEEENREVFSELAFEENILEPCPTTVRQKKGAKPQKRKNNDADLDSAILEMNSVSELTKQVLKAPPVQKTATQSFFDSLCTKVETMNLNLIETSQLEMEFLSTLVKFEEKRQK